MALKVGMVMTVKASVHGFACGASPYGYVMRVTCLMRLCRYMTYLSFGTWFWSKYCHFRLNDHFGTTLIWASDVSVAITRRCSWDVRCTFSSITWFWRVVESSWKWLFSSTSGVSIRTVEYCELWSTVIWALFALVSVYEPYWTICSVA